LNIFEVGSAAGAILPVEILQADPCILSAGKLSIETRRSIFEKRRGHLLPTYVSLAESIACRFGGMPLERSGAAGNKCKRDKDQVHGGGRHVSCKPQMSCKCCRQRKANFRADDASAMPFKENVRKGAANLSSPGILTVRYVWGIGTS
jgi:hypothetical protein